jgi:hypothetical protein
MMHSFSAVSNPAQIDSTKNVSVGGTEIGAEVEAQVHEILDRVAEKATQADVERACDALGWPEEKKLPATIALLLLKAFHTSKDARFFQRTGAGMSRMTQNKAAKVITAEFGTQPVDGDIFVFSNRDRTVVASGAWQSDGFLYWREAEAKKNDFSWPDSPEGFRELRKDEYEALVQLPSLGLK